MGAAGVSEDAEDLDTHGLWFGSGKDRPGGSGKTAVDLTEGEESARGGRWAGGGGRRGSRRWRHLSGEGQGKGC